METGRAIYQMALKDAKKRYSFNNYHGHRNQFQWNLKKKHGYAVVH
jgi:hypothetical protein